MKDVAYAQILSLRSFLELHNQLFSKLERHDLYIIIYEFGGKQSYFTDILVTKFEKKMMDLYPQGLFGWFSNFFTFLFSLFVCFSVVSGFFRLTE